MPIEHSVFGVDSFRPLGIGCSEGLKEEVSCANRIKQAAKMFVGKDCGLCSNSN